MRVLRQELGKSREDLSPLYLLIGAEKYFIELFSQKFHGIVLEEETKSFNSIKIYDDQEDALEALQTAVQTVPMLGGPRVISLYSKTLLVGKNKKLAEYLQNIVTVLPSNVYLLIIAGKNYDKRLKIYKFLKNNAKIIESNPLTGIDLYNWIRNKVNQAGKKISGEAVLLLEHIFSNHLHNIENELDKVFLFIGKKDTINLQDLQACISRDYVLSDKAIFQWVDFISKGQVDRALLFFHEIAKEGDKDVYLFSMLYRQIRLLALTWELKNKGMVAPAIAKRLKEHPYPIKKLAAISDRFNYQELTFLWQELHQINWRVLQGEADWKLSIEIFFHKWQSYKKKTPSKNLV